MTRANAKIAVDRVIAQGYKETPLQERGRGQVVTHPTPPLTTTASTVVADEPEAFETPVVKAECVDDYDYPVVKAFQSADYRMNTLREIVKTLSHAERVILAGWLEESKDAQ